MSLIPSLLLYNPLEMFVIILGCNLFVRNSIDYRKLTIISYIGGAINLAFQYIPNIMIGHPLHTLINNLINFAIVPLVIFIFLNFSGFKFNINQIYIVYMVNIGISMFVLFLINNIYKEIYFGYFDNFLYELLCNFILRFFEIILLFIINYMEGKYERIIEENC